MKNISQEANVTKDDQKNINSFSKMYSHQQQIDDQVKQLKEKVNKHEDTLSELEMNDDQDVVRYRFGNCFFSIPTQQARELVEKDKNKVQDELKAKAQQSEQNTKKMRKLKATLYSKFGNSINLQD